MTIREAIETIQELKPNAYTERVMLGWLTEVDQRIVRELYDTHVVPEAEKPTGTLCYNEGTDPDTELLVPEPYARGIYQFYLGMMIDLYNMETEKYNNESVLYNSAMSEYKAAFNRKYMPVQKAQLRF